MAKRIFKYNFEIRDNFKIQMPRHAEILCVKVQGRLPQLWALIDDDAPLVDVNFSIHGTGHEVFGGIYVDTFMTNQQALVWHMFRHES